MVESAVVEVDGVFVGTAILRPGLAGRVFFATHERLRLMHGRVLPTLAALRHEAARQYRGASTTAELIAGVRREPA